jgi:ComF family protein
MVNMWPIFSQIIGGGCPLCRRPGNGICRRCARALPYNRHPCPRCALPLPERAPAGILCADCQARKPTFDRVLAPLLYQAPVNKLVAGLKYHHQLHFGPLLAGILAELAQQEATGTQLLLPVPLQAQRLRERGFNQAAELTRCLSLQLGIPWSADHLLRIRGGDQQQTLKRGRRRQNVRGAFACRGAVPARVALIDDVMTTGATAEEASRMLKAAGVESIEVWTVARTARQREL